eukprot:1136258-Pelagomonas_calceolata.AAC.2
MDVDKAQVLTRHRVEGHKHSKPQGRSNEGNACRQGEVGWHRFFFSFFAERALPDVPSFPLLPAFFFAGQGGRHTAELKDAAEAPSNLKVSSILWLCIACSTTKAHRMLL